MTQQVEITLPPYARGYHLVTDLILDQIDELPQFGLFHVFIKHTSAGLTINENCDPTVLEDFNSSFDMFFRDGIWFFEFTNRVL